MESITCNLKHITQKDRLKSKQKFHASSFPFYSNSGFSLIEMVVVIGIFAVLSSVVFANYGDFNVKASLDNLTHQVALYVRQAQVYGISVSSTYSEFKGYGVYFSASSADQKTFIFFNDQNGNGRYDPMSSPCSGDPSDECVEKIKVQSGDYIYQIWANQKTLSPGTELEAVHIVFTRPNPDARILGINKSDGSTFAGQIADVEIYLKSAREAVKRIVVWSTGQVAVE